MLKNNLTDLPTSPIMDQNLSEFGLYHRLDASTGIILTEPLGYKAFMNLIFGCKFVITDSGGVQEETTYLKIPCLTLRPNTERPVTVSEGTNKLSTPDRIEADLEELVARKSLRTPLLWDGKTAVRVVKEINTMFG
jgi:UDP-N-acetylglucosamine 2-epimerase (non-hydrolysing)